MSTDNHDENKEFSPQNSQGFEEIERSLKSAPGQNGQAVNLETDNSGAVYKRSLLDTLFFIFSDKTYGKIMNVFFICFLIHCAEQLLIIPRLDSKGIISKIICLAILFCYSYVSRIKPKRLGFVLHGCFMRSGFAFAVLLNLITLLVYAFELLIQQEFMGKNAIIRIYAYGNSYSAAGQTNFILNLCLLVATSLFASLSLEMLFRGLLLRTGRAKFGFWPAVRLQAVLYACWFLVIPLCRVFNGSMDAKMFFQLILFYLVYETVSAVKWAMCVRITGTVWLCFFDHFIFNVLIDAIHIIDISFAGNAGVDAYKYFRIVLIQVISLIAVAVVYKKVMKQREKSGEENDNWEDDDIDVLKVVSYNKG